MHSCWVNVSWGGLNKCLYTPDGITMTNQSKYFMNVQLGDPINILGLLPECNEGLFTGA